MKNENDIERIKVDKHSAIFLRDKKIPVNCTLRKLVTGSYFQLTSKEIVCEKLVTEAVITRGWCLLTKRKHH